MKRHFYYLMAAALMAFISACHHKPDSAVPLHRFEKVIFDTPVEQLQGKLASVGEEYRTNLLNIQPQNPDYMQMLTGFVQDPVMRDIYRLVDSTFGDMEAEAAMLGKALEKAHEVAPSLRYDKVYTYVSGTFDYDMRVGCNSHELIVSLDQYVLPYAEKYNYFNNPLFIVQQSRRQYLVADCMEAIARQHIAIPQDRDLTLLDYMVAEGKAIYFAKQTLPDTPDSLLMRYTSEQAKWMKANEKNVWGYLLQKNLLYETDYMIFHNMIDDAPKTNAFRDSSPRTPFYIGWKMVSQYVKNTGSSIEDLFEETNAQQILSLSNYRPQ